MTFLEVTCVDWQAFDGSTALLEAAKAGNELCLKILLNEKADPNLSDHMRVTPLMAGINIKNILLLCYSYSVCFCDLDTVQMCVHCGPVSLQRIYM